MIEYVGIPTAHAGIITDAPRISEILLSVLTGLLQTVGALGIIVFAVVGVAYLFSGGKEKRIETLKKWMKQLIVGLVIIFGALVLLRFLAGFFIE